MKKPSKEQMAEWNAKLKAVTKEGERFLTHEEEGKGVHYGAEGAEDFVQEAHQDALDREIAAQLEKEGPGNTFGGSPENQRQLLAVLHQLIEESGGQVCKVGVHESCVTGDPCVVLKTPDGQKYHYNTRRMQGFDRFSFEEEMEESGFDLIPDHLMHGG